MPNQNQSDPNQGAPQSVTLPSFSPQSDLPPLPPDFQNLPEEKPVENTPPQKVTESPVVQQSTVSDGGSAAPSDVDISSVISKPKKKFGGGKIIATILGLFVLIGGVGAGIVLTQEPQLLQQKAATNTCSEQMAITCGNNGEHCEADLNGGHCVANPTPAPTATTLACTAETVARCHAMSPSEDCQANASGGQCVATPKPAPTATCSENVSVTCGNNGEHCEADLNGGHCVANPTVTCALDGKDIIVGNSLTGNCYQGGVDNAYTCYKLTGNHGEKITGCTDGYACDCACPTTGFTWQRDENGAWWCFNTAAGELPGQAPYAERCSVQPQQCTAASPTPTGSSVPAAPYCAAVEAFNADMSSMLTATQLSALTSGITINFCVRGVTPSGSFDKAQFTINGTTLSETTSRNSRGDFCQNYTILSTDTTVTVTAKIHHSTLGWF